MSYQFSKKDNINKKSAYVVGAVFGVAATVITMLIFSAILLFLNIDRAYAVPFATISLAVGSFVAGR